MDQMQYKYKAFVSYSHSHQKLAAALQIALQRFGRPWHAQAVVPIFRDATNLSATPELWPKIQEALGDSEFFLLLASEESARSKWVTREIQYWYQHRDRPQLLLLLAGGQAYWDDQSRDFDFKRTTALPKAISKMYSTEPLYADFRDIKSEHYNLSHPGFCDKIATVAATLHGKSKDELFGYQVSTQIVADAKRLTAEAELCLRQGFPQRSLLLSCAALKLTHDRGEPRLPAAESALRSGLNQFGGWTLGQIASDSHIRPFAFSADSHWLVTISADGSARIWELFASFHDSRPIVIQDKAPIVKIEFSADNRWLVTQSKEGGAGVHIRIWDIPSGCRKWHDLRLVDDTVATCVAVSQESTYLAAAFAAAPAILIWSLADLPEEPLPSPQYTLTGYAGGVRELFFTDAPIRLISRDNDGGIRIWELDRASSKVTWKILEANEQEKAGVWSPSDRSSPDGRWFLWCDVKSQLEDWRSNKKYPLPAYGGEIWKHAFSPDSLWLATATGLLRYEELTLAIEPEYTVRLWDLHSMKSWELKGHQDIVCDVAFTPDTNRLVSCSLDRTIRVWDFSDLRKFQLLRMLNGEGAAAPGVSIITRSTRATFSWTSRQCCLPVRAVFTTSLSAPMGDG